MDKLTLIKQLRDNTLAPLADCKSVLEQVNFDFDKATDLIKSKGLNITNGSSTKIATEGLILIQETTDKSAAMIEVSCNTDFCAKSSEMKTFAQQAVVKLANLGDKFHPEKDLELEKEKTNLIAKTKENIAVSRWWQETLMSDGKVFTYTHANNKIGVLLSLIITSYVHDRQNLVLQDPILITLGNDLAMQIAAMKPLAISPDKLQPQIIERQKGIFQTQLKELNKPEASWNKILDGKLAKWYKESCLLEQTSVIEQKTAIKDVISKVEKTLGAEIFVANFIRAEVGENIEKNSANLAEDVSKLLSQKTYEELQSGQKGPAILD